MEAGVINGTAMTYDAADHRIGKGSALYFLEGEHLESVYSGLSLNLLTDKYFRGAVVDEIVNAYHYRSSNPNDWTNYTFHHDHLNSVTALTDPDGTVMETNRFDAFGAPLNLITPGTGNNLLYTGREYDRESGLARFTQRDPIGFGGGINVYAYVSNNPVNFNDPTGLVVYLGARPAVGTSNYHTTLVLIPDAPQNYTNLTGWSSLRDGYDGADANAGVGYVVATLGAQPSIEGTRIGTAFGDTNLTYRPNHPDETMDNLSRYNLVPTPPDMTDTQFINNLINAAGSYDNSQQYFPLPVEQGGYNSNSFTAGVISAAGGTPPAIDYSAPGYIKPLPLESVNSANGGYVVGGLPGKK